VSYTWVLVQVIKTPGGWVQVVHKSGGKQEERRSDVEFQKRMAVGGGNKVNRDKCVHTWVPRGSKNQNASEKVTTEFLKTCSRKLNLAFEKHGSK
jgi:hypothetical protein